MTRGWRIALALAAGLVMAQAPVRRPATTLTPVHDPSAIKVGDTWIEVSTGQLADETGLLPFRTSTDLKTWTVAGKLFDTIPDWAAASIRGVRGLWAPDIARVGDGYRVYYSVSTFGSRRSAIGLATAASIDPATPAKGWTDRGQVFASTSKDDFNAIDPNLFVDTNGDQWLVLGSFWSGIKLIRIDPATGKASSSDPEVRSLARRPSPGAVEGPNIVKRGDYYYLFASFDKCCVGVKSTYYTVVGRAKTVTGPYVDYDGKPMLQGHAQVVLHADLDKTGRWKGPGGGTVVHDGDRWLYIHHAYDAQNGGMPTLRVTPLGWTADGWPVPRP